MHLGCDVKKINSRARIFRQLSLSCSQILKTSYYHFAMADTLIDSEEVTTRQIILESARIEVDQHGIIGLRLASVARRANVSIPLISRYFGGRDGLLAEVLGCWYEQFVTGIQALVDSWLDSKESLTLEEWAMVAPKPRSPDFQKAREFRLQVLALAVENAELRKRITHITTQSYHWTLNSIKRGKAKLPEADRHFDERIFSLLLFNTMYVFSDLVEGRSMDDDDYFDFIVRLVRASSASNRN